jgi:hypothetical protein
VTVVHRMLVVCRITTSLRGGCIYKRVDVMAARVWCLHKRLPVDDVLKSKHVGANHM